MKTIILLLLISVIIPAHGQYIASDVMPRIPTSPQAFTFLQYGKMAVNTTTGIPNISIPLYEIDHHGYKLPLALKYNPIPLRPGYNFDVYGQGWNFSINSSISRSIVSAPDEIRDFQLDTDEFIEDYFTSNEPRTNLWGLNFARDKFSVILPDGSGFNFVIEKNHGTLEYKISDGRQVKIICSYYNSSINSFTITDENGIKYSYIGSDKAYGDLRYPNKYVSWRLTRIDLPYSPEPITFEYNATIKSSYNTEFYEQAVKLNWYDNDGPPDNVEDLNIRSLVAYEMHLLTSIHYGSSSIKMVYQNGEQTTEYNYVNKIQIYESTSLVKEIQLDKTINTIYSGTTSTKLAKLDSITIRGNISTGNSQTYRVSYQSLSSSFSGTDHWGNLNTSMRPNSVANINFFVGIFPGETTNSFLNNSNRLAEAMASATDLCPYFKLKASDYGPENYAPRAPSTPGQHGVISRITYPTRGYTEFEFENHKYLSHTDAKGNYIYNRDGRVQRLASGFRIRKITNKDADGSVIDTKIFYYGKTYREIYGPSASENLFTGSGEPVVDPTILTYQNSLGIIESWPSGTFAGEVSLKNMLMGLNQEGEHKNFTNSMFTGVSSTGYLPSRWEVTLSPLNFRSLLNGRQAVVYPQVTVYYGNETNNTTGKTVYKYDIYKTTWPDLLGNYRNDFIYETLYYLAGDRWIYDGEPKQYNNLIEKSDYKFDGQTYLKVKKEKYYRTSTYQTSLDYVYYKTHFDESGYHGNTLEINVGDYYYPWQNTIGLLSLSSKQTVLYSNSDSVVVNESYDYNSRHQLSKVTTTGSDGYDIVTELTYPTSSNDNETIRLLDSKNIISPVIEQKTKKYGAVLAAKKVEYKTTWNNCNYPLLASIYETDADFLALDLEPLDSVYTLQTQILDYSPNGNPLEVVSINGIHNSYIWSYNDRYPVVKIINATYSESSPIKNTIIPNLNFEACTNPGTNTSHLSILNSFYNQIKNILPLDCLFYIYTYDPLIGVTSETNSNGITTYYEYDNLGRLHLVKNDDRDITNRYNYHYKH